MGSSAQEAEAHQPLPSDEIKRRIAEKAALVAELEARNPKPVRVEDAKASDFSPTRSRITVDGRKLAALASRATRLADKAAAISMKANAAERVASEARLALDAYMAETGLR